MSTRKHHFGWFLALFLFFLSAGPCLSQVPDPPGDEKKNPQLFDCICGFFTEIGGKELPLRCFRRFEPTKEKKENGHWDPSLEPWNGKFTNVGKKVENRVGNVDTSGSKFPFRNENNALVTEASCIKFFDWFYSKAPNNNNYRALSGPFDGTFKKQAKSTPGFEMNCYGFATGKNYWITEGGWKTIKSQEYDKDANSCKAKGVVDFPLQFGHCFWISSCCDKTCAKFKAVLPEKTEEKYASSPAYNGVWKCADGRYIEDRPCILKSPSPNDKQPGF
jgi:hypothetical protein